MKKKFQQQIKNLKTSQRELSLSLSLAEIVDCLSAKGLCSKAATFLWESREDSPGFGQRNLDSLSQDSPLPPNNSFAVVRVEKILSVKQGEVGFRKADELRSAPQPRSSEDPVSIFENEFSAWAESFQVGDRGTDLAQCFGVLSYDAARYFEPVVGLRPETSDPDLLVMFPSAVVSLDYRTNELTVVWDRVLGEDLDDRIFSALEDYQPEEFFVENTSKARRRFSKAEFVRMVEKIKGYISAGDVFQAVLSNTWTTVASGYDPVGFYKKLVRSNPSPFQFCIGSRDWSLVGSSPERFLKVNSGSELSMKLVAGTYPRKDSPAEDKAQLLALLDDEKERAEHFMLVDHVRNDLGRHSKIGSVKPRELLQAETYRDVHHLVSEVVSELEDGKTLFSALRACFPIATLTGTPKIRAMQIIEELEGERGVFGGSVFRFTAEGELESSVIIRSVVQDRNELIIKAGCGVVYDSQPEREDEECSWKAKALIDLLKVDKD